MSVENPGDVSYSAVGGLGEQIREIREVIELPLLNPELFVRVGIKPPKGVLLYGPPGTGKTLLARAIASNVDANFLKVVSSGIVDKYIGESARLIREMFGTNPVVRGCACPRHACATPFLTLAACGARPFGVRRAPGYARDHQPCIIFMDEIDAIGGRRFSEGTSADREIQRTLMEVRARVGVAVSACPCLRARVGVPCLRARVCVPVSAWPCRRGRVCVPVSACPCLRARVCVPFLRARVRAHDRGHKRGSEAHRCRKVCGWVSHSS